MIHDVGAKAGGSKELRQNGSKLLGICGGMGEGALVCVAVGETTNNSSPKPNQQLEDERGIKESTEQ